jgi:DNA-binding CsgD family transcriptional regulator
VLVGRLTERGHIDALLTAASAGHGRALVVRGEPGIGKSALLRYAEEQADEMRVVRAQGVETEAEIAFSCLHELLHPLLRLLEAIPVRQADALKGAFGLGNPVDARLLIGAGTLSLLTVAAEDRPLLCLIDDAHWVDSASLDALRFAARRLEADPIAMVFAARDADEHPFAAPGIPEVAIEGLAAEDALELLASEGLPDAVVNELHAAAEGNPLALLELPAALSERQRAGAEALPQPLPVTKALQSAYAQRIAALPDAARRMLVVAAAEPSRELQLIERACAALGIEDAGLDDAEDAGLVAIVDARVLFHHPLVASAAYHSGQASDRRRIHAALADALEKDRARQAWHLVAAAAGPDARLAAVLDDAARGAYARSGYRSAATLLERSAALTPDDAERAERLYLSAVMHFYDHGIANALSLLEQAEAIPVEPADNARYRFLRLALWYYRDPHGASVLLLEEARRADIDPGGAARAAALAACFRATIRDGDGALEAAERARELAVAADEGDRALAEVGAGIGFVAAARFRDAGPLAQRAIGLFQQREWRYDQPEDWIRGYAGVFAGGSLVLMGEHEALRERVESLAVQFVPGDEVSLMLASGLLGTAHFFGGRWPEARARIAESLRMAAEIGWLGPQVHAYARVLAQLAAAQGAEEETRAQEASAAPFAAVEWAGFVGTGALAHLALARRDYAEAVDRYEADVLPRVGKLVLYHDVADAVEAYLFAGRNDEAQRLLSRFVAQASEAEWPWALARAAHLEALSASQEGYESAFEQALEAHERARQPFLRARTELAYGDRLRRDGLRRLARDHLRAAIATFEALGAAPWADNAAATLRATGERVRRRSDPDIAALTPQELQVALIVGGGATNKEAAAQLFLSPKTIEKRLGSVYAKLGLRSRTDLARVLAAQEQPVPAPV